MESIKVFLGYFEYSIKKLFMYRVYVLGELFGGIILPIVLNFFLWSSLIETNSIGYNLKEMMSYIIISNVVLLFTQIHVEHELESDIKTYKLGQKLLLPVGYLVGVSYEHISTSLAMFIILYLPIIFVTSFFANVMIQVNRILYFTITLIIGFLLNALFSFIIGLLSFWITEIWGIVAIRRLLTGLLSGAIFPLDILPTKFESIILVSPFPYMTYIPSKLITDPNFDIKIVYKGLIISVSWVLGLGFIAFLLMKKGLKKYTLNGA